MNLIIKKGEKVDEYFSRLKDEGYELKTNYQNIHIDSIEYFLKRIDRYSKDKRDVIYCLLNNEFPNVFSKISNEQPISSGASVAHIASYIGILFRGNKKLDREGRDYWLKPLIEIGVVEPVTLKNGIFELGHLKAKSPNSAYRLNREFIALLQNSNSPNFDDQIKEWFAASKNRERLLISYSSTQSKPIKGSHKALIEDSINLYGANFLKGYICIFKDADDGNRISDEEKSLLNKYGIIFGKLEDVWPDAILYNPSTNSLWFIEAVTSDGEVDIHKLNGFKRICDNSNKTFGGCTTTYFTWKRLYERQKIQNNLASGSHIWIRETPEKTLLVN